MPFTLSHPAAAIPLRRWLGRRAVLAALVIGSMSPDFPYYSPIRVGRLATHTLYGVLWFCVPATVVVYFVFDRLMKKPLAGLLPDAVVARLGRLDAARFDAAHVFAVVLCAATGALTHVAWDSFTHADGQMVVAVPQLRMLVVQFGSYHLWLYKIFQHASTLLGMAVMIGWLVRWYRTTPPGPRDPSAAARLSVAGRCGVLGVAVVVALAFGVSRGLHRAPETVSIAALQVFSWYFVVATLGFFTACLAVYAAAWQLVTWRAARSAETESRAGT